MSGPKPPGPDTPESPEPGEEPTTGDSAEEHVGEIEDAEVSDGAGELGFYAPHSWWPILIALSFSTAAVGAALWLPWLIFAGVIFVLCSAAGLVFEYYIGPEKH